MPFSTPLQIIEEAKAGRMFILCDDEGRENEGDLIIPASHATPESINFMITHARGLVCLALTQERADELELELQPQKGESKYGTAFTTSIEAATGVTTGISAFERAKTISVAVNPEMGAKDIVTPGHIFPLIAREGGVVERQGHTEASLEIAQLAGLYPAAVICEIIKDDGHMARRDDLMDFACKHNLLIGTVADLVNMRQKQAA